MSKALCRYNKILLEISIMLTCSLVYANDGLILPCPKLKILPPKTLSRDKFDVYDRDEPDVISKKWEIRVVSETYLTISIDFDETNLKGKDCKLGGPSVQIRTYQKGSVETYSFCVNRKIHYNQLVSQELVEVFYCNRNGSLKFSVVPGLSGYVHAQRSNSGRYRSTKKPQWLAIYGYIDRVDLILEDITIRSGTGGGCKKGFISLKDCDAERSLLPSGKDLICPNNKIRDLYHVSGSCINVTFRYASFIATYKALSLADLSTSVRSTIETTPENTMLPQNQGYTENKSIYTTIGLGCAGLIIMLIVIFTIVKLRRRKAERLRRTSTNAEMVSTKIASREGTKSGHRTLAISNQMYDKVIKGENKDQQSPMLEENNTVRERNCPRSRLTSPEDERKQQRLSQLAGNYIGFVPTHIGKKDNNEGRRYPKQQVDMHHDRPPIPPPPFVKSSGHTTENKYESIDRHLTAEDLISPAYETINQKQTDTPETLKPQNKPMEVAVYVSSDDLQQDRFENNPPTFTASMDMDQPMPSEKYHKESNMEPRTDRDGYLALTSCNNLHRPETPNKGYVAVNSASKEDIKRHFQKIMPGVKNTTSMPNLANKGKIPEKRFPCNLEQNRTYANANLKMKNDAMKGLNNVSSNGALSSKYKHPRPSAPDIFIPCAYSSGEDISLMRKRLEEIAAKALQANEEEISESGHSSPCTNYPNEQYMYDSPRPSFDSSRDSFLERGFYDTPRPSLPAIFPVDLDHIVERPLFLHDK
ncbi:unnamed protein product [Clavelina lepadiformis]|uniref:CUB domain-containing protein n=1 Tax=Clavelina lepadiformis TaxID=159417 RepID=A0ABP0FUA5_CLALP